VPLSFLGLHTEGRAFFMGQVLMLSHEEYRGNRPIATPL
jgi:hypothetical protein